MRSARGATIGVLFGALLVAAPSVAPAATPLLRLSSSGRCPSTAQLQAALALYLPSRTARVGGDRDGAPVELKVTDLGARYRVEVGGLQKLFADPRHHCEERARAAAVFAALTLDPPVPAVPPPPPAPAPPPPAPPPPPPPAAATPPAPPPPPSTPVTSPPVEAGATPSSRTGPGTAPRRLLLSLEVGSLLSFGVKAPPLVTGGLVLRFVATGAAWGAALGFSGLPWAPTVDVGPRTFVLNRFPLDLDVRYTVRLPRLELFVEAGLSWTPTRVSSPSPALGDATYLLAGLGGRLAGALRFRAGETFRPYLGFELTGSGAFDLSVSRPSSNPTDPKEMIARTTSPYIWFGLLFGFAWNFD